MDQLLLLQQEMENTLYITSGASWIMSSKELPDSVKS